MFTFTNKETNEVKKGSLTEGCDGFNIFTTEDGEKIKVETVDGSELTNEIYNVEAPFVLTLNTPEVETVEEITPEVTPEVEEVI